ncbi:MAG TPA: peptidoglycan-associated lipoprotein Pal [Terriglobia bacterium]|nr:peptidoglycan-associated lipoprotein Pal [Terriglobia bacterium]
MRRLFPAIMIILASEFMLTACHKNRPPMTPLPQPPEAAAPAPPGPPVCKLTAEPAAIDQGKSVTLSWTSENATDVNIDPALGKQLTQGSATASPGESTTYVLTATGTGGSATCTARVTVNPGAPPNPTVSEENIEGAGAGAASSAVQDIFFDYDSADLRPDAEQTLKTDATFLKGHPNAKVAIQGNCDQRGSEEYNLGLGQRRANAARDYLANLGVPASGMSTVSYGKDKPVCTENTEDCWQRNRRDHLALNGAP